MSITQLDPLNKIEISLKKGKYMIGDPCYLNKNIFNYANLLDHPLLGTFGKLKQLEIEVRSDDEKSMKDSKKKIILISGFGGDRSDITLKFKDKSYHHKESVSYEEMIIKAACDAGMYFLMEYNEYTYKFSGYYTGGNKIGEHLWKIFDLDEDCILFDVIGYI